LSLKAARRGEAAKDAGLGAIDVLTPAKSYLALHEDRVRYETAQHRDGASSKDDVFEVDKAGAVNDDGDGVGGGGDDGGGGGASAALASKSPEFDVTNPLRRVQRRQVTAPPPEHMHFSGADRDARSRDKMAAYSQRTGESRYPKP